PAESFAVGRQVDHAVARNPLLAERAGKLPNFLGIAKMPRRLKVPERPPRRQRRMPEQVRHFAHHAAQIAPLQEVPDERSRLCRIDDADAIVRASDGYRRVGGIVPEQSVAPARQEQRHAHVRSRPMTDVCVPELACDAEAVESTAALTEAVEMLLAGKD